MSVKFSNPYFEGKGEPRTNAALNNEMTVTVEMGGSSRRLTFPRIDGDGVVANNHEEIDNTGLAAHTREIQESHPPADLERQEQEEEEEDTAGHASTHLLFELGSPVFDFGVCFSFSEQKNRYD